MNKIFTLAVLAAFIPKLYTELPVDLNSVKAEEKNGYYFNFKNNLPNPFEPEKKPTEAWSQNWMASTQENIRKSEYHFTWEEKLKAYCTLNRKHNLRFFYDKQGFSVEPRTTKIPIGDFDPMAMPDEIKYKTIPSWKINFSLDKEQVGRGEWQTKNNIAAFVTDNITVQYINDDEGMRQNFIVYKPLSENGELQINLNIKTRLKTITSSSRLTFWHKNKEVLNYEDLLVWDAAGKKLTAYFQKNRNGKYSIVVESKNAVYPITIDPISTTPAAILESNQAGAQLGVSVASAGDVNGDGYSDVIAGAQFFFNGQVSEWAAVCIPRFGYRCQHHSSGQLVKQLNLSAANQTISIPVQNLAPGQYWLRLQSGSEKQVLQFVKQ